MTHLREKQHVADRRRVRQQHDQTVDADAKPACWRHAVLERFKEVFVHFMCFIVSLFTLFQLRLKALALIDRIIQFGKGVGMFAPDDKQLKSVGKTRVVRIFLANGEISTGWP